MMRKKKNTSFLAFCIMLLILCLLPNSAFAADITVYLTVSAQGELQRDADNNVMAYKPVTVPEGTTIQGMIEKAHQDYLGKTEGFVVDENGVIQKLWNHEVVDTSKSFFVVGLEDNKQINYQNITYRKAKQELSEEIKDGYLYFITDSYSGTKNTTAFFMGDGTRYSVKYYSGDIIIKAGEEFSMTVMGAMTTYSLLPNYDIYASKDGGDFIQLDGASTDKDGVFTAVLNETGDYILTAKPQNNANLTEYMRPALCVRVVKPEDAPDFDNIQVSLTREFAENLLGQFNKDTKEYSLTLSENQFGAANKLVNLYAKADVAADILTTMPHLGWIAVAENNAAGAANLKNLMEDITLSISPNQQQERVLLFNRYLTNSALLAEYIIKIQYIPVLTNLEFSSEAVMPVSFNSDIKEYLVSIVDENAESISITPSINTIFGTNEDYTISINGQSGHGGETINLDLTSLEWSTDGTPMASVEIALSKNQDNYLTNTYTLNLIKMTVTDTPQFAKQPEQPDGGYQYVISSAITGSKKQEVSELSVFAVATQPVTYQWYCVSNDTDSQIVGATEQTYTPSVDEAGDYKYYCVAGYTVGELDSEDYQEYYTKSDEAAVKVYNDPTPKINMITPIPPMQADKIDFLAGIFDGDTYEALYKQQAYYKNGFYYREGQESVTPLEFSAILPDDVAAANPEVKYSWVYCQNPGEAYNPISIDNLNGEWYLPVDKAYGMRYYRPVVRVDFLGNYYESNYLSSNNETPRIYVFVDKKEEIIESNDWPGEGTQANPWQLRNAADIELLASRVNAGTTFEGRFFQMTADIELPQNFAGIGAAPDGDLSKGVKLKPFSGTFDGGNFTLTYAYGAANPLLNCAREATVQNLNIKAPYIANAGLLANYVLDYGSDGDYNAGTGGSYMSGTPDTLDVKNVTIKSGSNILKSGFIGEGGASGANTINIVNCIVESGVNIGYNAEKQASGGNSAIGSFAGGMSGTITNCRSAATVYGNSSIGGIVGYKSQSMGWFTINNDAFTGKIIATGNHIGGIVGSGYSGGGTAPNTPATTIRNCYVAADITGNDKVGGIFGGEPGSVQNWGIAYVQDNIYYGTITAADGAQAVGGIIGYMNSINANNIIESNYYLNTCGTDRAVGSAKYVDTSAEHGDIDGVTYVNTSVELPNVTGFAKKNMNRTDDPLGADKDKLGKAMTAEQFADGTVLELLNNSATSAKNWVQGDKYPLFDADKVIPVSLTISGNYKTSYTLGQDLDLSGAVFTLNMNDGSTKTVDLSEIKITGYDKNIRGDQELTATYNAVNVTFTVSVLLETKPGVDNTITVYFTLLGDDKHDSDSDGNVHTLEAGNLKTWISRTEYKVDQNAKVWDLIQKALLANHISWSNPSGNYIVSLTRNGVTIGEFTNGKESGWMYTINDVHSDLGVNEQYLSDGDEIVLHYTDGYTKESGSNRWGSSNVGITGDKTTNINPEASIDKDGGATANVTVKEITDALKKAKDEEAKSITITPLNTGKATSITIALPVDSAKEIAKAELGVNVDTKQGSLVIPDKALASIAGQAGGIDIRINIEGKDTKVEAVKTTVDNALAQAAASLRGAAETLFNDACVTEVTITSNGKEITSFDGHELTVNLPVNSKNFTKDETYKVVVVSADGTVETISGKCLRMNGGLFVQVKVSHLSTFIVLNEKEQVEATKLTMNFADVTEANWFYEAVKFVYEAGLMNGESDTQFMPNGNLNRAMLVTILYRLENQPEVTETNKFADVKAGQWYTEAVVWASANGIINGYEDGTFKPASNVSREEMAAMLMRYAKFKGIDTEATKDISGYKDANQVASWAQQNMAWANSAGLIQGDENNNLNPQGKATRAEAATILMRLVKNVIS